MKIISGALRDPETTSFWLSRVVGAISEKTVLHTQPMSKRFKKEKKSEMSRLRQQYEADEIPQMITISFGRSRELADTVNCAHLASTGPHVLDQQTLNNRRLALTVYIACTTLQSHLIGMMLKT
jgi:hypothetical protein